ncbi:hypothetical protein LTR84_007455 [Exophiala bonariae]|uniref:Protein CMS1 n=1 Tax=Exophiala bonariae TaxID=1690606 RepID=A0AAV9N1J2_9EURO|nr:hypothetical protein LTR84_007455 [Exophiala bonariae]
MSRTKLKARKLGSKKRKRDDQDNDKDKDNENIKQRPTKKPNLSKSKAIELPQRSKSTQSFEPTASPEVGASPETIASPDPSLLADQFANAVRKHFSESSSIELEEQYLPTKAFCDTTKFSKARVASNMPEFLEKSSENVKDSLIQSKGRGPHTLVITSSGIRTADVARELRDKTDCHVAKLIAKHMKLKANVEYMKKHNVDIAISTPMRLGDLVDTDDALNLNAVKLIVIDASYKDEKNRTIFELKELVGPLIEFLNRPGLHSRYGNGIQIMVF